MNVTMNDIIKSPLLLCLVIVGLLYIAGFSVIYLVKAMKRCRELGMTKEEINGVIKSSAIISIVPSLSIVVGLFVLTAVLGSVWSWWRLSVIGSLAYETLISSSMATMLGFGSSAEMMSSASGSQFGVVMILMTIGMLSGFLVMLPFGKKLSQASSISEVPSGGSTWKHVLSGTFMLVLLAVYVPIILFLDFAQAAVMLSGLVIALVVGALAKRPKLAWMNNFVMAFSMLGALIIAPLWDRLLG